MAYIDQSQANQKTVFDHVCIHFGPIEIPCGNRKLPIVFDLLEPSPFYGYFWFESLRCYSKNVKTVDI